MQRGEDIRLDNNNFLLIIPDSSTVESRIIAEECMMKIKLMTLVLAIATVHLFADHSSPYRCKMSGNQLEADIIVIGGGAAGCILMNKLSENGLFSVLGIEGGQN